MLVLDQPAIVSELTFGKVSQANGQFDLNYAVEIFNPTANDINLVDYSLQLTNASGGNVFISMSGIISSHGVYVVCNDNADLNL